ncbi:PIN domain-containing protein [Mesorhizobium sp.]|uniref:PIN-like domain-containing protein n=1 Tax=Mesorhizobium sp. TaxID=1871066 RepID=UPI000FE86A27|nr:PIN domain-containing protein [Mesorhizobium sp.]RWD89442.1 MAG: hypothetical protein EOS39_21460 [Mesorhizobium sp.]
MKGLFPQFDPGAKVDFKTIWEEAQFVFDTNVLLNLYRYRASTRDQLVEVLEELSDRIWIPHHVALEFQRNRLKVIADQNARFSDVRVAIDRARENLQADLGKLQLERRHSLIDPAPVINGFATVAKEFLATLDTVQQGQQKLTDPDPLKEKVETLFDGRVGPAPPDQKALNEIYRQAEARYAKKIPPGYMDSTKDKDDLDEHYHGGITYKRKFGDFVVWHQVLEFAKSSRIKTLIFVTDDSKEDWWWVIKSDGPKTLGPRPELIEEALRMGEVSSFHMYKPENFLFFSKKFLKADVSTETIEEVRDVSKVRADSNDRLVNFIKESSLAEEAVLRWLERRFPVVESKRTGFPDFVATVQGKRFGFEVKLLRNVVALLNRIRDVAYRAHYEISEGRLDLLTIVWVIDPSQDVDELVERMRPGLKDMPMRVRSLVGTLANKGEADSDFVPLREFALNELSSQAEQISRNAS